MEPTEQPLERLGALQRLDLDTLLGRSVDDVRGAVEHAGGVLRAVPPNSAMTLEYRPDRVTVVVENDVVTAQLGIG
jgi:hypothetical protein